jgi:peptide/nickel transport system substrate-binding protein
VLAALLGSLLLAFLVSTAASAETVLKVRAVGALKIVDPVFSTDYLARNHGYMIYDTLFAVDGKFAPKPQMVETWETSPTARSGHSGCGPDSPSTTAAS